MKSNEPEIQNSWQLATVGKTYETFTTSILFFFDDYVRLWRRKNPMTNNMCILLLLVNVTVMVHCTLKSSFLPF